jgi:S-adenosylmethionine/arginine decarboxylase-like enzyme
METKTPTDASSLREEFQLVDAWGLHSGIDLHGCNPETIRSPEKIKQFVVELCDLIEMKRFGECLVVDFGEDPRVAGYSMTQLIETSLISAHLGHKADPYVYLDIFSCKYYNPEIAAEFAKKFFAAADYSLHYTVRK